MIVCLKDLKKKNLFFFYKSEEIIFIKGAASEVLNKVSFYNSHGRNEPMSSEKIKEFQSHAELLGSDGLRGELLLWL